VRVNRRTWIQLAAYGAVAIVLGGSRGASGETEAVAFGVVDFEIFSNGCVFTEAGNLDHSDEWADLVRDVFADEGYGQTQRWLDASVDGRDWTDAGKKPSLGDDEDDAEGADFADVALLNTHGGHIHEAAGYYSYFTMGDAGSGCSPNTRDDIRLGNDGGDLEIAILAACQSGQYDVWTDGGYFDVRASDGTFNTWLAFHGNSFDGSTDVDRFEDYLEDSFENGLGDNWLDELYRNPVGADNEQCPIAIVFCEDESDCDSQFDWGGFKDRFKVAIADTKSISKYFYLGGCDPGAGPHLPN
jgi:hypothetical protein